MATLPVLASRGTTSALVRLGTSKFDELRGLLFRRYPHAEWATFGRFGWRETSTSLVLTLAHLDPPRTGELDDRVSHVAITESYTLRTALAAEDHPLAVGVAHSHPRGYAPRPSPVDDEMDAYYADYFDGFTNGRPYVSLILSEVDGELAISGRVFWRRQWLPIARVIAERTALRTWVAGARLPNDRNPPARTARLAAAFGDEAATRLRRATVAVIGAGGTGSAAIEVLARAGVGRLIIVDPDRLEESNLERVHGSSPADAAKRIEKARLARYHVHKIDPDIRVEAYYGALPQAEVLDAVVTADVALGCTDRQHSRLALSDVAVRYLVPSLDCGVMLEGRDGAVTGQILQIVRFLTTDPCAWCRSMIIPERLAQELMSESERTQRRAAAEEARRRGENPDPYWQDEPQLNTVGYHTTIAGAMTAGYAIGWLTGRFDPPFTKLQMNLVGAYLDVTDVDSPPRPNCSCRHAHGWADQGIADALVVAPTHWPEVKTV